MEGIKTMKQPVEAVRQDGWALGDVPEGMRTSEICLAAVRQDGAALHLVPDSLKTPDLFMEAPESRRCELNDLVELVAGAMPESFFDGRSLREDVAAVFAATPDGKMLAEEAERLQESSGPSL